MGSVARAQRMVSAREFAEMVADIQVPGAPRRRSLRPSEHGVATRGNPAAAASSNALGIPSCREDRAKRVALG